MTLSPRLQRSLIAAISGALLTFAFPRLWFGWVAWFALAPLLVAIRRAGTVPAAGYGWVAGFVFFLGTLYWIPDTISNFTRIPPLVADALWVLMAAANAYSFMFFAAGVEWLAAAGIGRLLAAPMVWVVIEWTRTFVVAGFPWNSLGYSQVQFVSMIQIAEWTSVYGLSASIVLTNMALAELWVRWRRRISRRLLTTFWTGVPAWALVLFAALPPLLLFTYGMLRLAWMDSQPFEGALRVGIVQGNVAQDQKWDEELQDEILARYLELSELAVSHGARLLVWPEAALPFYFEWDERSRSVLDFARTRDVDVLLGAPGLQRGEGERATPYNQAWLVRARGGVQGPYNKIQLVPFGEYIPLHGLFGWVDIAAEAVGEFGRGTEYTVFETIAPHVPSTARDGDGEDAASGAALEASPLGPASPSMAVSDAPPADAASPSMAAPARFATLICYEGIFPALTRRFGAEGIDFLVNISNDAWYGDTAAPDQHLAMAALRSVENRVPMVRSTNTGISAFVTAQGHIGPTTPLFEQDVAVETILLRRSWSFYREHGDVFLYLCMLTTALLAIRRLRATPR